MRSLLLLTLISVVAAASTYLDGLNRTFDEIEQKIVDIYVTMPVEQVRMLDRTSGSGTTTNAGAAGAAGRTGITAGAGAAVGGMNAGAAAGGMNAGGFQMGGAGGAGGFGGFQMGGAGGFQMGAGGFSMGGGEFKYDNATIVMKWDGNEKIYENSSFKVGGASSVQNDKQGYNIKLSKKFMGRKNIRIRPDCTDRSFLRTKLCCDIANRMGVPSIQASYARLYMNNEFWGFYVLLDSIKPSWIKQTFNPSTEEITTLYQCKNVRMDMTVGSERLCVNANDDISNDMTLFSNFIKQVNNCKTADELEKILDVDVFLKYMAFEWLIGSFDHFLLYGHNFYFYQRETDGKWLIIEYDYDSTFGVAIKPSFWEKKGANQDGSSKIVNGKVVIGEEPIFYTFSDWEMNRPIINVLVHKNLDKFKSIVREVLVSAFNPYLLKPRIGELKEFVAPFVKEDFAPQSNGRYPGRINPSGKQRTPTFTDFENTVEDVYYWVDTKFEVACENYGFDPEEILKEAATYVAKPFDYASYGLGKKKEGKKDKEDNKNDTTTTTTTTTTTKIQEGCWASALGYSCCKTVCNTIYIDQDGQWSIEDGEWCGIVESQCQKQQCFGESTGEYPCCESCNVVYTDQDGKWGVEKNNWCSIKYTC